MTRSESVNSDGQLFVPHIYHCYPELIFVNAACAVGSFVGVGE